MRYVVVMRDVSSSQRQIHKKEWMEKFRLIKIIFSKNISLEPFLITKFKSMYYNFFNALCESVPGILFEFLSP